MNTRITAILLLIVMLFTLCSCAAAGDIAGEVAAAAQKELVNQVTQLLEEYKVTVVETKTAFGKLNDEGSKLQFFCAFLIQSNSQDTLETCKKAVGAVTEHSGVQAQAESAITSTYLVHKTLAYNHTDFSQGNYYTLYLYIPDLSAGLLDFTLPTLLPGKD